MKNSIKNFKNFIKNFGYLGVIEYIGEVDPPILSHPHSVLRWIKPPSAELSMIRTTGVISLAEFKAKEGITTLPLYESRKRPGRFYVVHLGEALSLAEGTDLKQPLFVWSCSNSETGETWSFISNQQAAQPVGSI